MVFDTKYKRMNMQERNQNGPGDVDRNDFFQINTYMSYYQNHTDKYNVKVGGLLYPIETKFTSRKHECYSETWFGNTATKFIVDGIDLSKNNLTIEDILKSENAFIDGIQKISENRE